jgi:hypothetical protein
VEGKARGDEQGKEEAGEGVDGDGALWPLTRGKVIVESNSNREGGEEEEVGREGRRTGSVYADLYK